MLARILWAAVLGAAVLLAFSSPEERGKGLFPRRCGGCHALDLDKGGPRLRGVYGRQAASLTGYPYSDALKQAGIRWDEASLDRWLTDPETVAPGADMAFRVLDADERKALVAYLKSLSPPLPVQ